MSFYRYDSVNLAWPLNVWKADVIWIYFCDPFWRLVLLNRHPVPVGFLFLWKTGFDNLKVMVINYYERSASSIQYCIFRNTHLLNSTPPVCKKSKLVHFWPPTIKVTWTQISKCPVPVCKLWVNSPNPTSWRSSRLTSRSACCKMVNHQLKDNV